MTRGISEKRLREWRRISIQKGYDDLQVREALDSIINECKELNGWKPIDENTPKDRTLIGFVDGKKRLIKWGKTSHVPLYGFCLADQGVEDFDICHPTQWQELPTDPV